VPGVDSASNRNEYQEYFLGGKGGQCVVLRTLPLSCAECLEIWETQPFGTLSACPDLSWDCFTFTIRKNVAAGNRLAGRQYYVPGNQRAGKVLQHGHTCKLRVVVQILA